ncbi:MAG: hypothetical protein EAZ91_09515 [Cytophagales bacterium]|nr:MAG: hypothetical protein EAZ91_09515 [Cytophagales bacterium]
METIFFNQLSLTDVDKKFGLRQVFKLQALADWLAIDMPIDEADTPFLLKIQNLLRLNVFGWNEQELSLHFIGPLFSMAELSSQEYNLFAQRQITAQVGDYILTGKPDGMVASGYREPEVPYFAFQEYKKEKDPNGDPAAQALGAMLVGQSLNTGYAHPLYGCYVVGQNWYFIILDGRQYAISPAYSALTDEVFTILRALKALKPIVEALLPTPVEAV